MQNNQKREALNFIEENYLHMSDDLMSQHLGLSLVTTQRLRIQNGFIRDNDPVRLVRKLHPDTLCWLCKNSVPSPTCGCSWSELYEPVEGWTARLVKLPQYESYHVYRCPEFVGDRFRNGE